MEFIAIRITPEARDALRNLSFSLTGQAGQRVTLSDALIAAVRTAQLDPPATIALLPSHPTEGNPQ